MFSKNSLRGLAGIVLTTALCFPAFPIAGLGIHYGMDFSLSMDDALAEQVDLSTLKLDVNTFGVALPTGLPPEMITGGLTGKDLPITIDRSDFSSTPINIGAKLYVDIIPFIDAVEVSGNIGMWDYKSKIKYPTSIAFNSGTYDPTKTFQEQVTPTYDSIVIENIDGLKDLGVENTPYAKLNIDLTIRKYIVQIPPVVHMLKVYGGAGATLNFATPVLSAGFIDDAIGDKLGTVTTLAGMQSVFNDGSIEEEFMKQLFTPHFGAHLDLGAMFKIPVVPIGLYIDGKFYIPFGDLDKNVSSLKSTGLALNAGIALAF